MKRYSENLVRLARRMVGSGSSLIEVGRELGINQKQVGVWCQDIEKSRFLGLITYHQDLRKEFLDSEKSVVQKLKNNKEARFLCGLIYGCEGAKYPATNGVALVNSEPAFIKAFLNLMRKGFMLNEEKWRAHLQVHTDQDYLKLRKYWSDLTDIPESHFFRPTVTKPKGKKHRNNYCGTCTVKYGDYRIQLKLIGIYEEFLRKYQVV